MRCLRLPLVRLVACLAILVAAPFVAAQDVATSRGAATRPTTTEWRRLPTGADGLEVAQKTLPGPNEAVVAWLDLSAKGLEVRSFHSKDAKGKETLRSSARAADALIAVNTHFFDMETIPTPVLGWEVERGVERAKPLLSVVRGKKPVAVSRSALWIEESGKMRIGWVAQQGDDRWSLPQPLDGKAPPWNADGPKPSDVSGAKKIGRVKEAVGAGPMLLRDGKATATRDEERMFEGKDVRHPRTALGVDTRTGKMLWVVVDGRHPGSVGMTLAELADFMKELGCTDALNCDGGGSSTFILNGALINRPLGGTTMRAVPTGLGVFRKAS